MASINVTFSCGEPGMIYEVEISTATSSAGSGSVPAEGGYLNYDDSHGDNYYASTSGRSGSFNKGASSVNINLC